LYRLGKYQLVARLGTGGMAEVWRARVLDERDARAVVVKRVLPGYAHDPSFARSLRIEAQALTQLRHPGIVQLHALEEIDGQMLLVLEHVDGCDVRTLVKALAQEPSPPPPGFGAFVIAEVCRALGHAHRFAGDDRGVRSILHRDVSPSNVMITRDGAVKLVDFGIAKSLLDGDEATRSRSIKGKLSYMAPEQLDGQTLTCAADVYSAGVLLHELLTGRRLFTVTSPVAMAMVRQGEVPPPSSINPAVPATLDAVCRRAVAFAPASRFADGQEMAETLAPIARELGFGRAELCALMARVTPVDTEPTAATATVPELRPRSRRAAWLALALLPLLGAAAWAMWPRARITPLVAPPVAAAAPPIVVPPAVVAAPAPPVADPTVVAEPERPHASAKPSRKKSRSRSRLNDGTLAPF
jgi:serine/threonine protein kinase